MVEAKHSSLANDLLTSRDVANLLAAETGLSQQVCYKVLRGLTRVIKIQLLLGHQISLSGLGRFYTETAPSKHINYDLQKQQRVSKDIPSYRQAKFKMSPALRRKVR